MTEYGDFTPGYYRTDLPSVIRPYVRIYMCDSACQTLPDTSTTLAQVGLLSCKASAKQDSFNSIPCTCNTDLVAASQQKGMPFMASSSFRALVMDVSGMGWGTHLVHPQIQRTWSLEEMKLHIRVLELRAIRVVCMEFLQVL